MDRKWVVDPSCGSRTLGCEPRPPYICESPTAYKIFKGTLSDRFGKKWFILAGCLFGVLGTCIAGSANTITGIIGGNVLVGISNAGCIVSMAANQEIVPNKYRPIAMGICQAIGTAFSILGTFVAGAVVKYNVGGHGGWRWAYYINAILYGVASIGLLLTYFPPPPVIRRQESTARILAGVDYGGILLLCASITPLVLGLTWGGTTYPWESGEVVATLTCGCAGLIMFSLYEWLVVKRGLFDHRLMQSRNFLILLLVCMIDGVLLLGVNVLYAQEIADLFSQDAVKIALILSPYLITSTTGCLPVGWLMARTKSFKALLVGALSWCGLFLGLMALVTHKRLAMACVFSALFGVATAVTTVIPITTIALSVPSFLIGTAGTLATSTRALGGIVGVTIFTAIYNNKISDNLAQDVSEAVIHQGYNSTVVEEVLVAVSNPDPTALQSLGLPGSLMKAVADAIYEAQAESWKFVWVAMACIITANAIISLTLKPVKHRMNEHVESALERSDVRDAQLQVQK